MSLLEISDLSMSFQGVRALDDVCLSVDAGESVALVGGSGAGKSTVARIVAGLSRPDSGTVTFGSAGILGLRGKKGRAIRRDIHMVFQDPYASLPPSSTVADIIAEPMVIHGIGDKESRRESVLSAMEAVNLIPAERYSDRYAYELSGGERQRVAFARAVVTKPKLILADEPTSGLDASLRVEIIDLMVRLCQEQGIAILHITHDLALAQRGSDRVVVMQGGRVVESGPVASVLGNPQHHYTAALVAAAAAARS